MNLDLLVLHEAKDICKSRVDDYQRIATRGDTLLWQRIDGNPYTLEVKPEVGLRHKSNFLLFPLNIPRSFSILIKDDKERIRETTKDGFGKPLTYICNFDLQRLKNYTLAESSKDALISISHLSKDLPVILYYW